jgi:arylformamidase
VPKIYDISQPVGPGIWVWPGDRAFERAWTSRMADGASCNVGRITMSCHTGTHVDAPYHFSEQGGTVETLPLEACVGPAVVVPLGGLSSVRGERVLVRAGGAAPVVAAVERLRGLKLFGTDAPSVDPMDSTTLDVHHALWTRGAVILEGLDLSAVPDGEYQLIALPLKLAGMDAAPVRAILIEP